MASAEREPITGIWGGAPSGVQGQSPWSVGQGAKPPPEAETFLAFGRSLEAANLEMQKNHRYLCCLCKNEV